MARDDRVLRGIRTPMKSRTVAARLSPGEGPAEMIDAADLIGFVGLDVLFTDSGTIDFTYDSGTNKYSADYIGDLADNADVVLTSLADGEVLTYELSSDTWINAAAAGGASDFLALTDTPANYTGDAGKVAQVNVGETALEFVDPAFSGGVFIGDGRFAPPAVADFSTHLNHGAGTTWAEDNYGGATLMDVTSTTNQFVSALKAIPAGAWTATMKMRPMYQESTGASSAGFQIKDSSTGETVSIRFVAVGAESWMYVSNYTNNTFNANLSGNVDLHHEPIWIQVEDNTTNFIFRYSPDGVNWKDMVTVGRTAHMTTPDLIGFFLFTDVAPTALNITYYDDDDDPATTPTVPLALGDLNDVNVPTPTDKDLLQWDNGTSKWVNFGIFSAANTWTGSNSFNADFAVDSDLIFADVSTRQVAIGRAIIGTRGLSVSKNMETRRDGGGGAMINTGFSNASNQPSLFSMEKARGTEATPLALQSGDDAGAIRIRGYDGAGFDNDGNFIVAETTENWGASAHGFRLLWSVTSNGSTSVTQRMLLENDGGFVVGSPTGGSNGAGTINAQAVYDDNVLLTCYPLEAYLDGAVDVGAWDARVVNRQHPETRKTIRIPLSDGSMTDEEVTDKPAWEEVRTHAPAAAFALVAERRLDPKTFYEDMVERRALPGMPTKEEWAADGPRSVGETVQTLWEVVETQSIHIKKLLDRIETLEGI